MAMNKVLDFPYVGILNKGDQLHFFTIDEGDAELCKWVTGPLGRDDRALSRRSDIGYLRSSVDPNNDRDYTIYEENGRHRHTWGRHAKSAKPEPKARVSNCSRNDCPGICECPDGEVPVCLGGLVDCDLPSKGGGKKGSRMRKKPLKKKAVAPKKAKKK